MRPRLTYANVIATLALVIAVGGASAFAASQLGKNSVGPKQLKKNAVTTAKIKKEAVTAAKVKKGTLTGSQINISTLGMVPFAANAQALGGQSASQISEASKLRCPSGTTPSAGVCIEGTERTPPATFTQAMLECAHSNRRLPSMGDLVTFDIENFSEPPNPEWVEPTFLNGALTEANIVSAWAPNNLTFTPQEISTTHRYRCVTTPAN